MVLQYLLNRERPCNCELCQPVLTPNLFVACSQHVCYGCFVVLQYLLNPEKSLQLGEGPSGANRGE
jgi:hypothetical protein